MAHAHRSFVPAAGHDWLLFLYDPLGRLFGSAALHEWILDEARLAPGQRVLDVGCGTGSLAVRTRQRHPGVEVVALDPDPKALAIARRKATRAGVDVRFEEGFGDALPFADGSFDRIFSSLMLHHLPLETKQGMLREVARVLRPGGSFHLADFGHEHGRQDGLLARLLHRGEDLQDQDDDRIAQLLREAGLREVARTGERRTLFGRVAFHRAVRPA